MTRLRLRETITLQRPSTLSSDLRSNIAAMEVSTIESSDVIIIEQEELGVKIISKDSEKEIFVPWAMVRSVENEKVFPVSKKKNK